MEKNFEKNRAVDFKYRIDLYNIYDSELNKYKMGEIELRKFHNIHFLIERLILKNNPQYFIQCSDENNEKYDVSMKRYYDEFDELNLGNNFRYCFYDDDKIYDIKKNNICITKSDVDYKEFEKLFLCSLRIYEDSLSEIYPFLNFQVGENFDYDYSSFHNFLEVVLTQYDTLINPKIAKFVNKWMTENHISQSQKNEILISKKVDSKSAEDSDYDPDLMIASYENIPEQYKVVDLKISRLDTMRYFSFFYKPTMKKSGKLLKPLISKEDFISIFKYGIAIPPKQKTKLVEMNFNDVHIGNIEYAIYNFYSLYGRDIKNKKQIMTFFGNHFECYQEKISTPEKFHSWNSNLNFGIEPKGGCILDIPSIPPEK